MKTLRKALTGFLCAGALASAGTAQAAGCWDAPHIGAARVAEFQTLMMVATLRCKSIGVDLHDRYEHFLEVHRATLRGAQDNLRLHFAEGAPRGAPVAASGGAFDHFLTGVANFYGMGSTNAGVCERVGLLLTELGKVESTADLLAGVMMEMVRDPHLDAARCPAVAAGR